MHKQLPDDMQIYSLSFLNHKDFAAALVAFGLRLRDAPFTDKSGTPKKAPSNYLKNAFLAISESGKLMKAVDYAAYDQAKQMIAEDSSLMFKPVSYLGVNGQGEQLCPLEYAFKKYDTYMWKLFYEKIKDNENHRKKFIAIAESQIKHIDLEAVVDAYREYSRYRGLWWADEVGDLALNQAWSRLCATVKENLPAHMLKEFARASVSENANFTFDVTSRPQPENSWIYDARCEGWKLLTSFLADPAWGQSCVFLRDTKDRLDGIWRLSFDGPDHWSVKDLDLLQCLFKARKNDFAELLLSFNPAPLTTPFHQLR